MLVALAATLGLVGYDALRRGGTEGIAEPAERTPAGGPAQRSQDPDRGLEPPSALPARRALGEPSGGLFTPRSWQPAARKARVAPAAPAPVAPPVPFRYAGKVVEGGSYSILLARGDQVFPVAAGDTLDGLYRVDAIGEAEVVLTYLPLARRETIPIDSSLPTANLASHGRPAGDTPPPLAAGRAKSRARLLD